MHTETDLWTYRHWKDETNDFTEKYICEKEECHYCTFQNTTCYRSIYTVKLANLTCCTIKKSPQNSLNTSQIQGRDFMSCEKCNTYNEYGSHQYGENITDKPFKNFWFYFYFYFWSLSNHFYTNKLVIWGHNQAVIFHYIYSHISA